MLTPFTSASKAERRALDSPMCWYIQLICERSHSLRDCEGTNSLDGSFSGGFAWQVVSFV